MGMRFCGLEERGAYIRIRLQRTWDALMLILSQNGRAAGNKAM